MLNFPKLLIFLLAFFLGQVPFSLADKSPLSLNSFLEYAYQHSQDLKAIDLDIKSLQMEIQARELEQSPSVSLEAIRYWEDRPRSSASSSSTYQSDSRSIEMILTQPLPTGTRLELSSDLEAAGYSSASQQDQKIFNGQIGVTQSLWQDALGRKTSLRRKRDKQELQSRQLALLSQRQGIIIDLENAYWDLVYALQEESISRENLGRSRRMETWMKDRLARSAAERNDLLQAQALVAQRELQWQLAVDNLESLRADLRGKLPLNDEHTFSMNDLKNDRELSSLLLHWSQAPIIPALIGSLQQEAQAAYLGTQAKLDGEGLKPVLEAGYSYGRRGIDSSASDSLSDAFKGKRDYHQVGVLFSVPLNLSLLSRSSKASLYKAKAQEERSYQAKRQSQIGWEDLSRRIAQQKKRVRTALRLSRLQNEKSREERALYEKGRSTAFQAITFEQEAAQAELLVLQLMTQLRKTESLARNYAYHIEGLR
jgi:outer membrane protein TolC